MDGNVNIFELVILGAGDDMVSTKGNIECADVFSINDGSVVFWSQVVNTQIIIHFYIADINAMIKRHRSRSEEKKAWGGACEEFVVFQRAVLFCGAKDNPFNVASDQGIVKIDVVKSVVRYNIRIDCDVA